jgi:2-amino-4-hydroxy-6-hydroxymethyldihydropteridine diphosphokinase
MAQAFIGLGTNLGDRGKNLEEAIRLLSAEYPVKITGKSSSVETEPVDYLEQPYFLNQVIVIETEVTPRGLLRIAKEIEERMGREKTVPKGPRIIDLDILLYDDLSLDSEDLTIPHREIENRRFILEHLVELNPDLADPVTGTPYSKFLSK